MVTCCTDQCVNQDETPGKVDLKIFLLRDNEPAYTFNVVAEIEEVGPPIGQHPLHLPDLDPSYINPVYTHEEKL